WLAAVDRACSPWSLSATALLVGATCRVGSLFSVCLPFFFNGAAAAAIYILSLHDALPILRDRLLHGAARASRPARQAQRLDRDRSEEHTSELQSPDHLVSRLLLEKKNNLTAMEACRAPATAAGRNDARAPPGRARALNLAR